MLFAATFMIDCWAFHSIITDVSDDMKSWYTINLDSSVQVIGSGI